MGFLDSAVSLRAVLSYQAVGSASSVTGWWAALGMPRRERAWWAAWSCSAADGPQSKNCRACSGVARIRV
jgi:hypothetical protein